MTAPAARSSSRPATGPKRSRAASRRSRGRRSHRSRSSSSTTGRRTPAACAPSSAQTVLDADGAKAMRVVSPAGTGRRPRATAAPAPRAARSSCSPTTTACPSPRWAERLGGGLRRRRRGSRHDRRRPGRRPRRRGIAAASRTRCRSRRWTARAARSASPRPATSPATPTSRARCRSTSRSRSPRARIATGAAALRMRGSRCASSPRRSSSTALRWGSAGWCASGCAMAGGPCATGPRGRAAAVGTRVLHPARGQRPARRPAGRRARRARAGGGGRGCAARVGAAQRLKGARPGGAMTRVRRSDPGEGGRPRRDEQRLPPASTPHTAAIVLATSARRGGRPGSRADERPGATTAHASPGVWLPERPLPAPLRLTSPNASELTLASVVAGRSLQRTTRSGSCDTRSPGWCDATRSIPATAGSPSGSRNVPRPVAMRIEQLVRRVGVDDAVALAAAEVQAHVALVVGGMREGLRLRPVHAAQLQARGELERRPVGQRPGERPARAAAGSPRAGARSRPRRRRRMRAVRRRARRRASRATGPRASC